MPQMSMNELTTFRWSFEEDVARYSSAGIGAIGVWRPKLSDYGEEKGIELLAESGLRVSNLLWAGGFTGSDGRSYRESVDDALEAIRLAELMGAPCLVVYSGPRAGHTANHSRRLCRDALKELGPAAAEAGIVLALEPMHSGCAADWTFLTNIDDAISLLDEVDHPNVRLGFDTYHLAQDDTILDRVPQFVHRVAVVHLADAKTPPFREQNRSRLGSGTLPLRRLLHTFMSAGYEGIYDVLLMGEDVEDADYVELLEHSKQMFRNWSECAPA